MHKFYILLLLIFINANLYSQTSFSDALKIAKEEDRIIIVDVYTDWCVWCKKMDKDVYGKKEIKKIIKESFILIKLNAESEDKIEYNEKKYTGSQLAEYFQVSGYPTTVFLDSNGKVIEFKYDNYKMVNLPGYFNLEEFKKILNFFKEKRYKDQDLSKFL